MYICVLVHRYAQVKLLTFVKPGLFFFLINLAHNKSYFISKDDQAPFVHVLNLNTVRFLPAWNIWINNYNGKWTLDIILLTTLFISLWSFVIVCL